MWFIENKILIAVSVSSVLVITWQILSLSNNPQLPDIQWRNSTKQGKLVCQPGLFEAARAILEGENISIPYGNEMKTLWPFQKRASLKKMLQIMDIPKMEDITEWYARYNRSLGFSKARKFMFTFGHNCCTRSRQRAVDKALETGAFDQARWFDMSALSPRFRQQHHNVLKTRRGAGYWLWKPYIALKILMSDEMAEGDILMYEDAGTYIISSPEPLLKLAYASEKGVLVFRLTHAEEKYTKRDAWVVMDMDVTAIKQSHQRLASFFLARKCCSSIQFFMEWVTYLSDRRIASDDQNKMGLPNSVSFKGHRHDQSVLSLLSKKWGILALRDPSQFGNAEIGKYWSPYGQIVKHALNSI